MEATNPMVVFDQTDVYFPVPLQIVRLDKKSTAYPELIIVFKEDENIGEFKVLGCYNCDGSLENLIQILREFPEATGYTKYNGMGKEKLGERIKARMELHPVIARRMSSIK